MNSDRFRFEPPPARPVSNGDADLFRRATEAWADGRDEEIIAEIEAALDRSMDYRLWHIHGLMHRRAGRRDQALPSLRRAVELNPQAFNPVFALAQTLNEAGLPSIDAYGHALRLSPGNPEVVTALAMALVGNGEVGTAIAGLEKITARSPNWVAGQLLLSQLRWMEGERGGFTRNFDEALAADPAAMDLRYEQIVALTHAEHWDEALRVIADGRKAIGDSEIFDINEAVIHAETGNSMLAEPVLERFAKRPDPAFQVRRVRHFLRSGRPDAAAAVIEPWLQTPDAFMFWPYASLAWRQTNAERWHWLEGDPAFVGVYDIEHRLPPLDRLADTLRQLHQLSGEPLEQSLRGGSQTDGDLFTRIDPVLVALREAVREVVAEHAAQLPPRDPAHPLLAPARTPIAFAGAWSVRLRGAGFHANHVHPMGWFSSALYIALPPCIGQGESGVLTLGEARSTSFPVDLPPFRTVEPRPGRLALFPSYMWHGTKPFGEGERLTVAFDVARNPPA